MIRWLRQILSPKPEVTAAVGRNEPCPCGSGQKFKRCCLGKVEAKARKERAKPVLVEGETEGPVVAGGGVPHRRATRAEQHRGR